VDLTWLSKPTKSFNINKNLQNREQRYRKTNKQNKRIFSKKKYNLKSPYNKHEPQFLEKTTKK